VISRSVIAGCFVVSLGAAARVDAQQAPQIAAEYRADAIVGRGTAAQGGVGVVVPLGVYVRLGFDASGGAMWRDGQTLASGRFDGVARFLLDPFREAPFGLSIGGGLSVPYVRGDAHVRPYLTTVVDVEGRMRGRFSPAFQIGLGGGTRIGVVIRSSTTRWR
jgi:hypothetical protein